MLTNPPGILSTKKIARVCQKAFTEAKNLDKKLKQKLRGSSNYDKKHEGGKKLSDFQIPYNDETYEADMLGSAAVRAAKVLQINQSNVYLITYNLFN